MVADKPRHYVSLALPDPTWQALVTASVRNGRRPKPQAVVMLTTQLLTLGYLAPDPGCDPDLQPYRAVRPVEPAE